MGRFLFPWISFFWMENLRHTQIAPLPLEINFHTISSTCCYETPLSTGDKDRKSEKIESFRVQSHCIKIGIWLSKYSTKNPSMAAVYSQERVSHTTSPFFFFAASLYTPLLLPRLSWAHWFFSSSGSLLLQDICSHHSLFHPLLILLPWIQHYLLWNISLISQISSNHHALCSLNTFLLLIHNVYHSL